MIIPNPDPIIKRAIKTLSPEGKKASPKKPIEKPIAIRINPKIEYLNPGKILLIISEI